MGRIVEVHFVNNKAKGRISKRVFQENKARQVSRKTDISSPWYAHVVRRDGTFNVMSS